MLQQCECLQYLQNIRKKSVKVQQPEESIRG